MRQILISSLVAVALFASGSACGMTRSASQLECRVSGAEKLPDEIGGEKGICSALARASAEEAPGVGYSADIRILSDRLIAATMTLADGTVLPEQKMAISDSHIRKSIIDQFAKSLAQLIATAGR